MTNETLTTNQAPSPMKTHLTILAALHIALGILTIVAGLLVAAFLITTADPRAWNPLGITLGTILAALGTVILALAILGVIGGGGLLQRRPWARRLVLIVGALNLLNLPIGTLLGAYTIWVLVQPAAIRLLTPADERPTASLIHHA